MITNHVLSAGLGIYIYTSFNPHRNPVKYRAFMSRLQEVFTWRGSGADKQDMSVILDTREQITEHCKRLGMDLREAFVFPQWISESVFWQQELEYTFIVKLYRYLNAVWMFLDCLIHPNLWVAYCSTGEGDVDILTPIEKSKKKKSNKQTKTHAQTNVYEIRDQVNVSGQLLAKNSISKWISPFSHLGSVSILLKKILFAPVFSCPTQKTLSTDFLQPCNWHR